jgi:uncharacterized membrane protein YqgA involved in biofilm formation
MWSRKVLPIISGLGLISLIIGINLLDTENDLAGLICTFFGGLVFFIGLILTFIKNVFKRRKEPRVKYGRFIDKDQE